MRVGLVLGGGGVVGLGYHAGALAALAHDWDWDPRDAEVVVGTSAGSVIGALLRSGVPAGDLAAALVGADTVEVDEALVAPARELPALPPLDAGFLLRWPRVPPLRLVLAGVRRPWRVDPVTALAALLPAGDLDLASHLAGLADVLPGPWPERALWLTAVRETDLRLVTFGRPGRAEAALDLAVAASCAVPGYFTPVEVDGERYLDGGVRSPTNADLLARYPHPLDLVIVLAPLSARAGVPGGLDGLIRAHARRRVRDEAAQLRAAGLPTVVVEPGARVIHESGSDLMSDARMLEVVREAFLDTGEQLRAPFTRTLLAGLAPRRPRAGSRA